MPEAANIDGKTLKLVVLFEEDEDGWVVASCPTLHGCLSQGRTKIEALDNIREAVRGHLASIRAQGAAKPGSSDFEVIEVRA